MVSPQTTWIAPYDEHEHAPGTRPVYWLRSGFDHHRNVSDGPAKIRFSARGLCEVYVNDELVTDDLLLPGFTQYNVRIPFREYDVSGLLRSGANTVSVLLGDGWYRGQTGLPRAADQWGTATSVALEIFDQRRQIVATNADWTSSRSHIVSADLIAGQSEDRRIQSTWSPVVIVDAPTAELVAYDSPPVRRTEILPATTIRSIGPGRWVVDFGQNSNGWCRLHDLGPLGTRTVLTHAEWLGPNGDITTDHLAPNVPIIPHPLSAGMIDQIVSAGAASSSFEPRFTTHGFRYARIERFDEAGQPYTKELLPHDIESVVVHSDLRRTGWFRCSDDRINRLHEVAVWSLRGNMCEIPTDCPTRERSGWTGDWQIFAPSASFLFDVDAFTRKWLADVRADQRDDGAIANISPSNVFEGFGGPLGRLNGSAGWGDVIVLGPWALYQAYGDTAALRENVEAMCRWVDFGLDCCANGRSTARQEQHSEPLEHERYLWDTGFHWGEWLEPGVDLADFFAFTKADKSEVATAYLANSACLLGTILEILGDHERSNHYKREGSRCRDAWRTEFLDNHGMPKTQSQAAHVRPLVFGFIDDHNASTVASRLAELVKQAGTTVGTGFLSTAHLLPVLADNGLIEFAYTLLAQPNNPGWMYMIDSGATTVWERWEGVDAQGVPHESLNHYSKSAVVSFLHRYVAGLAPIEPGYRSFSVRPLPGGGLSFAEATFDSVHGRIHTSWTNQSGTFELRLAVPIGTTAEVTLPSGARHRCGPGDHLFTEQFEKGT